MIKKPKKSKSIKYWQNKCDRLIQELGRKTYDRCLVCGGEYSCLHHFIPKSRSTHLRYDWENLIPICAKCHTSHHQGLNSTVHATIQLKKGEDWTERLLRKYKAGIWIKAGRQYYEKIYNELKLL